MEYNCLHCNQVVTENFCGSCGQKKHKRIDKKYIWDEIQYTILHTNKGFLYSVKNTLRNPGLTAKSFIDGDRVAHYKPILLAFVLSGISAFISYKIIGLDAIMKSGFKGKNAEATLMEEYMTFINNYSSLLMLVSIPILAIFTKLAFRKWGQNYYEHVIMNAYGIVFYTLLNLIFIYPFLYFFRSDPHTAILISTNSMIVIPFAMVWFFKSYYPERSLTTIILRILLITVLAIAFFYLVIILFFIGYIIVYGPEVLKQFQQIKPN